MTATHKLFSLPLVLVASVLMAVGLSACSAPAEAPAADATEETQTNPNGEELDVLGQEELDEMSTARDVIRFKPLELVLPLVQHGHGTAEIVDPNGNQVQQDAQNYLVSKVERDASVLRIHASRLTWEESNQLEDSARLHGEISPNYTLAVVDTAGNTVDPFTLNYVVLDVTTEGQTDTYVVEPNREYVKGAE